MPCHWLPCFAFPMHPSEIGRSYDQIAPRWLEPHLETNGMAAFSRALQFLPKDKLPPLRFALDVGCGCSSRFVDLLMQEGFAVTGVDVSAEMIAIARQRRPEVAYHVGDIATWELPRTGPAYHFISAWDSTWHLPLAEQVPVLRKLCAALAPGGVLIFTTGGLDAPEEKHDSSMGVPVHYSVLGIPETLRVLAEAGCICRHLEYDQQPELHVYVIAQKSV